MSRPVKRSQKQRSQRQERQQREPQKRLSPQEVSVKAPVNGKGSQNGLKASEAFLNATRRIVAEFNDKMLGIIEDAHLDASDFIMTVNENVRRSYVGSVLVSIEIMNRKRFKTSKIVVIHGYNVRESTKTVLIMNSITEDIMFQYIGTNAVEVFQRYLEDILVKNVKFVIGERAASKEETDDGKRK